MRSSCSLLLCASLLLWASMGFAQVVVDIDVKPGSEVNSLNVKSKGLTPVAMLCSPTFDPATILQDTLMVGLTSVRRCTVEDVNADACLDLLCHASTPAMGVACGDTEVTVTAMLSDGMTMTGADMVHPVGCGKPKKPKVPKEPKTPKEPKAPKP